MATFFFIIWTLINLGMAYFGTEVAKKADAQGNPWLKIACYVIAVSFTGFAASSAGLAAHACYDSIWAELASAAVIVLGVVAVARRNYVRAHATV